MNTAISKLYTELQEDIAFYAEMGTPPANRLSNALKSIRGIMQRLKETIITQGFPSDEEEILFFKSVKPLFVSEQIYLTEYATIFLGKPSLSDGLLEAYYVEELRRLHVFFNRYGFLYQCYKLEASDLDSVLFLRDAGPSGMVLPETPGDPSFTTSGDHLWAKFMAYERLVSWMEEELRVLRDGGSNDHGAEPQPTGPVGGPGGLRWTGESINLVELAYSIWLTGQLNNGQVSITEIVEYLEVVFRIRIGKAHRRWQGIANRKRLGHTKYLDECKAAIEKRVEEELGR